MRVHPIADEALGNTSYFVDVGDGTAFSVDPRRDADDHLTIASREGLRIAAVLETHLHADFISGAREIAAATGADIIAAAAANLGFDHHAVEPGDRLLFAGTAIEVIATPGHTPEHIAYLSSDGERGGVFSGGSLIVGGAARTDLTGTERTDELARAQYASLRTLGSLAGDTALYPTHGGGSFCSTGAARSRVSTIGDERMSNPLLSIDSEDEFVEALRRGFGSYPRYFRHLRAVNRDGPELLSSIASISEMSAREASKAVERGAWLIDVRPVAAWASGHAKGSVSIELRPAFASWLGWVVPFGEPFALMVDTEQPTEAVRLARRIGYDAVAGWIRFETWRDAGLEVSTVPEIDPTDASDRVGEGAVLLDVRQANEFASRHIAGATNLELGDIIAGKTPEAREVITYCGHGERSATAASLLERRGITVANLRGGTSAWRGARLPLEP